MIKLSCITFWNIKTRGSFLKSPGNFSARKGIFSSSVSQHGEVYTAETTCMKGTYVHIKNTRIKQLCNHKVQNFAAAFRVRQLIGTFEIQATGRVFGSQLMRTQE